MNGPHTHTHTLTHTHTHPFFIYIYFQMASMRGKQIDERQLRRKHVDYFPDPTDPFFFPLLPARSRGRSVWRTDARRRERDPPGFQCAVRPLRNFLWTEPTTLVSLKIHSTFAPCGRGLCNFIRLEHQVLFFSKKFKKKGWKIEKHFLFFTSK